MKKIAGLFLLLCFETLFSQNVLPDFPDGQSPYKGGTGQMLVEMQDYFRKSGLHACEKNEAYMVNLKIDETGRPALIKRKGDEQKNNCAFDLAVKSLGSLRNWQPAEEKGKKVVAYFSFPFMPQDFFDNFKTGYDIPQIYRAAEVEGGKEAYRKEIIKNLHGYIDWDLYLPNGKFIVTFDITSNGKVENMEIEPKVQNSKDFFDNIKFAVKRVNSKWTPAKIKGIPIDTRVRLSLNFISD
ncbi:MAG: hypothetical protein EAS48_05875 [Chryseobacterium sp.]|nr:MAG: hypothetical protein EAS48_05875 [Chryseobacterium sp.]